MWKRGTSDANHAADARVSSGLSVLAFPAALFGLHTFILMGAGVQGDAVLAGGGIGGLPYYARETALLLGFVLCSVFAYWRKQRAHAVSRKAATGLCALLAVVFAGCTLAMQVASQAVTLVVSVLAMELVVGLAGGVVYEKVALLAWDESVLTVLALSAKSERFAYDAPARVLGIIAGVGGALAVVAQYLLQIRFSLGGWFAALLAACFCLLAYFLNTAARGRAEALGASSVESAGVAGRRHVLCLVAVVACLFVSLSLYEVAVGNVLTSVDFYQWHRLFLAVGYLVIGMAAFFGGRSKASVVVVVMAPFTAFVLSQTALLQVGPFTMALFYTLLGAVIAYSGISFMAIAPQTGHPALVASMGRMLEGLITIAGGGIVVFAGEWSEPAVLLVALGLIALTIALMVRVGLFASPKSEWILTAEGRMEGEAAEAVGHSAGAEGGPADVEEGPADVQEGPADVEGLHVDASRVAAIAQHFGLTRRETEILGLVFRGLTAQQMADELVVTKSTVKFHVTNILRKTGSETRQQLVEKLSAESEPAN